MRTRGAIDLKKWRKAKGYSQAQAGALIGVSQPTFSHYESGLKRPEGATPEVIAEVTEGAVPVSAWWTAAERKRVADAASRVSQRPAAA